MIKSKIKLLTSQHLAAENFGWMSSEGQLQSTFDWMVFPLEPNGFGYKFSK